MAKVKDQVLPGSDISYIDSTGVVHYDADLIRHIMPNAYPLPSLNPTGVARETARNKRPPDQGKGSPLQEPQRKCFRSCVDEWYNLERKCPDAPMCHGRPSLENVWQQKVDQGVMCSYYDLFMSCCMSKCQPGGTISKASLDCFDCPAIEEPPCAVGFTTEDMLVGESQDLSCVSSDPCCICPECTMELTSGGGELIGNEDGTWTYNAPDENPNCENNPTISLCCEGFECTELKLAVNATMGGDEWAVLQWIIKDCTCFSMGSYGLFYDIHCYNCKGVHNWLMPNRQWGLSCADAEARATETFGGPPGAFIDRRSPEMIAAGCCPPQLV